MIHKLILIQKLCIWNIRVVHGDFIYITIQAQDAKEIFHFIKYHLNAQLISIFCTDYPDANARFTITYNFLFHNVRFFIQLKTDELTPVPSISNIYANAVWYEREIWDLFGIFFLNNSDLRRILNDYGFEGHPFRKDFPLSGYTQLQYDLSKKRIISVNVELSQTLRSVK